VVHLAKRILAVHEKDLDTFLESLGLLEALEKHELRCSLCDSIITRENFLCAYPENGKIQVCCNAVECYKTMNKRIRKEE
jgi:hypothetical protein